jgi:hypothetical protein
MVDRKISDLRDRWDALRREHGDLEADDNRTKGLPHDDPRVLDEEARVAALTVQKDAVADAAWGLPARDMADLLLLAEIAYDLFWGDIRLFPEVVPEIEPTDDRSAIAVAYLVRGIADVAAAPAVPLPPRRAPSATLIAEIARMVASVAEDEAKIGVLSTGEAIAVALVLNRADLLPHGGYTWIEAVDRLGPEWFAAAQAVQRQRDT